jgi:hypothetical protein
MIDQEKFYLPDSLTDDSDLNRRLAGLEVSVEDYDEIIVKHLYPLFREYKVDINQCAISDLVLGDNDNSEDCVKKILLDGFEWANFYSGTLQKIYYDKSFGDALRQGYEIGSRQHGISYIGIYAGPYVEDGRANPFIKTIRDWQEEGLNIDFYLSNKRLPVHGCLTDKSFIFESVHSEFIKKRRRWQVNDKIVSGRDRLMGAVSSVLDTQQGKFAPDYSMQGKNEFLRIRESSKGGITDFKSPVRVKGVDELFNNEMDNILRQLSA